MLVTHGHGDALIAHLTARGIEASMLATRFVGEGEGEDGANETAGTEPEVDQSASEAG